MRENRERLRQLLPGKLFCSATNFDRLPDSDPKVFRLINEASRNHFIGLGGIDHIQAKEIFLLANAYVKAVAVIRRVRNESAVLKYDPLLRCFASAKIDSSNPKNTKSDRRD